MALLVSRVVEEVNTIPLLGLLEESVEVVKADPKPNKKWVIIIINLFYLISYTSSYNIHYQF